MPDGKHAPQRWPAIVPLAPARAPVEFPVSVLPGVVGDFVAEVAEDTQTPLAMASMFSLATLASIIQRGWYVDLGRWREPLGLYVAVVAESGERKSGVVQFLTAPIVKWESEMRQRRAETLETWDVAQDGEPPPAARIVVDDATAESMVDIAAHQGGAIAVISAEGAGPFALAGGRYTQGGPNFEKLLNGHSGDRIVVDRKGREPVVIDHPAWSFAVTCQREALQDLGAIKGARGLGLIARFFYAIAPSAVGDREIEPARLRSETAYRWDRACRALIDAVPVDRARVPLSEGAARIFLEYRYTHEPRLRRGAVLGNLRDWGSKLPGQLGRIAAILTLAEQPNALAVSESAMRSALALDDYLVGHALDAIAVLGADPIVVAAGHVLEWMTRTKQRRFSKHEAHQGVRGRAWCKGARSLDRPLAVLVEHNIIRPCEPLGTGGAPRRADFEVHPHAYTQVTEGGA